MSGNQEIMTFSIMFFDIFIMSYPVMLYITAKHLKQKMEFDICPKCDI